MSKQEKSDKAKTNDKWVSTKEYRDRYDQIFNKDKKED